MPFYLCASQSPQGPGLWMEKHVMLTFCLSLHITDEEEDDEEVYKMAGVMAQCGGLECMLNRLSGIKDFKQGRHLLTVSPLQHNFSHCWFSDFSNVFYRQ